MKTRTMAIAVTLLALSVQPVTAAGGYNFLTVPANSDVLVTVPFVEKSKGSFAVDLVTGNSVMVSGNPFNVDEFNTLYYLRFTSGNAKGLWSTISDTATNDLVLADTSILGLVANGDTFQIFKHHTLASVFPDKLHGVLFKKSNSVSDRITEILTLNSAAVGINKSAAATYYYLNGDWRRFGQNPATSFNDTVLPPQEYFIVRNRSASTLKYAVASQASNIPLARVLAKAGSKNDIPAGTNYPVPMTLARLNLGGTPAFETSPSVSNRIDELLVFNNSATGFNKSASGTYYYSNGAWRKFGQNPNTSFDNEVLPAGSAMVIRKSSGVGSPIWYQPSIF